MDEEDQTRRKQRPRVTAAQINEYCHCIIASYKSDLVELHGNRPSRPTSSRVGFN